MDTKLGQQIRLGSSADDAVAIISKALETAEGSLRVLGDCVAF